MPYLIQMNPDNLYFDRSTGMFVPKKSATRYASMTSVFPDMFRVVTEIRDKDFDIIRESGNECQDTDLGLPEVQYSPPAR